MYMYICMYLHDKNIPQNSSKYQNIGAKKLKPNTRAESVLWFYSEVDFYLIFINGMVQGRSVTSQVIEVYTHARSAVRAYISYRHNIVADPGGWVDNE